MANISKALTKKRKRSSNPSATAPSSTRVLTSQHNLPWKTLSRPSLTRASLGELNHEGAILSLEEVDDVEVIYETLEGGGKIIKFKSATTGIVSDNIDDLTPTATVAGPSKKKQKKKSTAGGGEDGLLGAGENDLAGMKFETVFEGDDADDQEDGGFGGKGIMVDENGIVVEQDSDYDGMDEDEEPWGGIPSDPEDADDEQQEEEEEEAPAPIKPKKQKLIPALADESDAEDDLAEAAPPIDSKWSYLPLNSTLITHLSTIFPLGPTPIQSLSLPVSLIASPNQRDVIGIAETGSGKTGAYGLPLLSSILNAFKTKGKPSKREMKALILCPTRELALQVSNHLASLVPSTLRGKEGVSIGTIVGGMAVQKQKRVLERGVDICICTPGRLWDLLQESEELARSVTRIKYLVIDEADRMVEHGHFEELEKILKLTRRPEQLDPVTQDFSTATSSTEDVVDEDGPRPDLQTFVFSATMSKELQRNLKRYQGKMRNSATMKLRGTTLDDLFEKLDFRDEKPEIFDLSPEGGKVKTLQEAKIECLANEKDLFLYYFLLRYPGRSLVFFGSIDSIRRSVPLLELLKFPVFPLHSQLQQKQRLKNLDRFKESKNAILLATDIAARGLDIENIDHVVHYHLPRSADNYVHRSGRTARAQERGFSLLLTSPEERSLSKSLFRSLKRDDTDIPELPITSSLLVPLRERILVARQIDSANHKVKKDNHERSWMLQAAEDMDIDIDSDILPTDDEEDVAGRNKNAKTNSSKVGALKAELRHLLAEPLVARGISAKYITSGSTRVVDALVSGTQHGTMLGMDVSHAADDAKKGKVNKKAGAR